MSTYIVGVISKEDGLLLNRGLDDDSKVAFQNAAGTEFYIKNPSQHPTSLPPSKYQVKTITQSVVDGSLPITKTRRIYP